MYKNGKQSIFSNNLTLHCYKCNNIFFLKKNLQIYRMGTRLTAFSALRGSRLLKLYQCEIGSCIYVGNEGFFILGPQESHFVTIFLDHSFLNSV